jgi:hypothetical protein
MGFARILQEKQEMAYRVTRKQFYNLLKQQFGWPKALLALLLYALLFFMIRLFGSVFVNIAELLIASGMFFLTIYIRIQLGRIRKRTGKRLLLIQNFYSSALLSMPLYFFINFSLFFERGGWYVTSLSDTYNLFLAVLNAFFIAVGIAYYQTFLSVKQEVMQKYPALFVAF